MLFRKRSFIVAGALLVLFGVPGVEAAPAKPTIVFMTDFGAANDPVAICKAVIAGIAPDAFSLIR
jgi:hypothetical protein